MNDKTGGSAFPRNVLDHSHGTYAIPENGMTLRDYFAAKAMQATISHSGISFISDNQSSIAVVCYEMADAMLKARGEV